MSVPLPQSDWRSGRGEGFSRHRFLVPIHAKPRKAAFHLRFWPAAALALALLGSGPLVAQSPPSLPQSPPVQAANSHPSPRPPVETFRQLLAMNPAERKRLLADRPPETQRLILAKVREYESLSPERRELRLQATELHYYLWPLMHTAWTNRSPQLALVPQRDRSLVEGRLREWDKLPWSKQQELLTNAATIRYFTELQTGPPPLPEISPARREKLEAGIREWRRLPALQRQRILVRFSRFFELTPEERDKALTALSETERRQIEKTVDHFSGLSPSERDLCIRSFEKFAGLSLAERQQFLKKAEHWKRMPSDERGQWIRLVKDLPHQPPLPPGLIPMPPAPPGLNVSPHPPFPPPTDYTPAPTEPPLPQ
jgi:Protein of unknown function (DUF3106)